jgi:hypothetical protein
MGIDQFVVDVLNVAIRSGVVLFAGVKDKHQRLIFYSQRMTSWKPFALSEPWLL